MKDKSTIKFKNHRHYRNKVVTVKIMFNANIKVICAISDALMLSGLYVMLSLFVVDLLVLLIVLMLICYKDN